MTIEIREYTKEDESKTQDRLKAYLDAVKNSKADAEKEA